MKGIKFYMAIVILILMGIIIAQNRDLIKVDLLWWHGEIRLVLLLLGIALSSALMTFLWMLKKK